MPRIGIPDVRGQFKFDTGSAATPSIGFRLDTDTGIYTDTDNTLSFSTSGIRRMSILPDGSLEFVDISAPGVTTNKLYSVGGVLFWNGSDLTAGLANVVEDTSPQLGGDLDVNGFDIISGTAELDLNSSTPSTLKAADGTTGLQMVVLGGNGTAGNGGALGISGGDGSVTGGNLVIRSGDGGTGNAGDIDIQPGSGVSNLGGFVNIKPPSGSTTAPSLSFAEAATNGTSALFLRAPDSLAAIRFWTLPDDDPSVVSGQFLTTDASGVLGFSTALTNVVDDTSPQLGGNLDVNDFDIVGKPAPDATSAGGSIDLIAANGGVTSGAGGSVVIKPGSGGGASANGTIRIQDPSGSNFMNLGEFIFSGGFSSGYHGLTSPNGEAAVLFSYGSGGGVFIKGQSGLATFPASTDNGAIAIYSGYGTNATYKSGTNITLSAGDAFNTTSASGGGIYLNSGQSGSSGSSGDIQLTAASARSGSTGGSGGSIILSAGTGGASAPSAANGGTWTGSAGRGGPNGGGGGSWTGGSGISYSGLGAAATLIAGANKGTTNGTGGVVSIQSGGSTTGAGGRIRLTSGYGNGVYNGGDIDLQTGVANGTGSPGNVRLFSNTGSIPELQFVANGGITGNTVGFKAPATITTSRTWTVPQDNPSPVSNGNMFVTDASGVLSLAQNGNSNFPVAPSYLKASLPTGITGGFIYVSDATGASVTGSLCFFNGTSWIDTTTGVAVV